MPPFGHSTQLRVFVDPDLLHYDEVWESQAAEVAGIATAIVANFLAHRFGLRPRRATSPSAVLLTRKEPRKTAE